MKQILLFITFFSFSLSAKSDIELNFGVYTSDKATSMVKMFRPILNHLEIALSKDLEDSVTIHLQVSNSYEAGIQSLVSGKVDFSRMGPASYVLSKKKNDNIKLLAMENKNGNKFFFGMVCVPIDSDIYRIEQLTGKSFAFGNKNSTIGRYLSQYYLHKNGINRSDLSHISYLSRHDKVASAVSSHKFSAGAIKENTFLKQNKESPKLRELFRFKNATKPWISRSDLPTNIFISLKKAIIAIDSKDILKGIKKTGFFPSSDSDFNEVRLAMDNNHMFFDKNAVKRNSVINP